MKTFANLSQSLPKFNSIFAVAIRNELPNFGSLSHSEHAKGLEFRSLVHMKGFFITLLPSQSTIENKPGGLICQCSGADNRLIGSNNRPSMTTPVLEESKTRSFEALPLQSCPVRDQSEGTDEVRADMECETGVAGGIKNLEASTDVAEKWCKARGFGLFQEVENIAFCLFPSPFTKESFLKAQSHWAYRSTYSPEMPTAILMIFQPGERNVFDQTLLIYELDEMSLGPSDWNRMIRLPFIYYRSMYGPEDFMTEDHWLARYRLERSQSKFQQVLTDQNFVCDHLYLDQSGVMNEDEFEEIKSTWLDILDFDGGRSNLAYQLGTNHKSSTS
ncbi:hypothetical protein BY996DRAFT_6586588 [Phakopsora pachyrhizi]|nr:hypothetical protein BY996DRAFT_6586588 [Phakopsora pachyrhizi]